MSTMRRTHAAISMMAGLSLLAGCAAGGMDMAPPTAAAPEPAAGDAPRTRSLDGEPAPAPPPPPEPPYGEAQPAQQSAPAPARPRETQAKEDGPRHDRPGLGTEWGETRVSSISTVPFERADPRSPFTTLALFYNDQEGANAMASTNPLWTRAFDVAGGLVNVSLRDDGGRMFRGFVSGSRDYIVGEAGRRYSIVLHNNTDHRLEVVLSVDGLDVMDGKAASFDKRGYILDARADLEVDGFRQSTDTVAAFRFGSVRGSYAGQKYGETRNVGVIGVALFHERGTAEPVWSNDEIRRRRNANPFPGEFATPPGS
jgi:hypothetical protein